MANLNSITPEIALAKGDSPKKCLLNGLDKLGGISKYINKGDQVFIKINLPLPDGYPTHSNFDVLEEIIQLCNEVNVGKIYVGSFPLNNFTVKEISNVLGLEKYLKTMNAELAYLDNSNLYKKRDITSAELQMIKRRSLTSKEINGKEFKIPKVILDSDKLISLNQINVHPVFDLTLSILNSYSMIPNSNQDIEKDLINQEENNFPNQYKQNLITNILDVFKIKKPDLIINDLFYILEGAGPFIFKDSNLKQQGALIVSNDAFYADLLTLKVLNFEKNENLLLKKASEKGFGSFENTKMILHNDNKEIITKINHCVSNLVDINVKNIEIYEGQTCVGCFEQAYFFLNFMKTLMVKDLKYISKNYLLLGEYPSSPENPDNNLILFGDCAINSTKYDDFRTIRLDVKKKEKRNKNILELPGCPPKYLECIEKMLKYYGKGDVPTINFLFQARDQKLMKKKEEWEEL